MDFRGTSDLPNNKLFNGWFALSPACFAEQTHRLGDPPDCSEFADEYCLLPYYVPVLNMMPVAKTRWVKTDDEPTITNPLKLGIL